MKAEKPQGLSPERRMRKRGVGHRTQVQPRAKAEVSWRWTGGAAGTRWGTDFLTLPWPRQVIEWLQNVGRCSWTTSGVEEGEDLVQRPEALGCEGDLAATSVTSLISRVDSADLAG